MLIEVHDFATGGSALATISTRSRSATSAAQCFARLTIPFAHHFRLQDDFFARISSFKAGRFDFSALLITVRLFNRCYSTMYRPRSATAAFTKSTKASIDIVPKFFLSGYGHSQYLPLPHGPQVPISKEYALKYVHES